MCNISSMYIDRGIQKGIDIGIAQGMEQGMAQENATMIMEMHKSGIPIETIAKVARKSVNETSKVIEENSKWEQIYHTLLFFENDLAYYMHKSKILSDTINFSI